MAMAARVGRRIVAASSPGERPEEWDLGDDEGEPDPGSLPGLLLVLVVVAGEPVLDTVLLCNPVVLIPVAGCEKLGRPLADASDAVTVVPVVLAGLRPVENLLGISPLLDVGLFVIVITLNWSPLTTVDKITPVGLGLIDITLNWFPLTTVDKGTPDGLGLSSVCVAKGANVDGLNDVREPNSWLSSLLSDGFESNNFSS
jgi:hypothetical protein